MKPCSNNRKLIAWLALGALEPRQERSLRAHLETCAGCRGYLHQISKVTDRLAATAIRSDIETSPSFHRRVVSRLRLEESREATVLAQLRAAFSSWRVALPATAAAIAVLIAVLSLSARRPGIPLPAPTDIQAQAAGTPGAKQDLNPTLSNYQMVANRSLEKLDELITRQGNRNPAPTPIYAASPPSRASAME